MKNNIKEIYAGNNKKIITIIELVKKDNIDVTFIKSTINTTQKVEFETLNCRRIIFDMVS